MVISLTDITTPVWLFPFFKKKGEKEKYISAKPVRKSTVLITTATPNRPKQTLIHLFVFFLSQQLSNFPC